ncbi:hypothetical protein fugu_009390 [Takifugu bimaculatus]|uniref:Uncharacterized protein n=1 Tax=Takifugu bimaculatus TaxID=433685 RepID=A0A4Z2AYJ1_9TELE|nr:hypothetical protein fugu_009390 [Takifugu bimaculatus]
MECLSSETARRTVRTVVTLYELHAQVRNLCYMVTRREKMKHTLCDLQEKIFHLQIQLLEEDIAGGLSKSFPLDKSLFDSWLAQSVQITADDMLSQWTLGAQHRDKSGSLLSDQLLQGEESLLNLMMENSMQSTWKTPHLGRKLRGSNKSRTRGLSQSASPGRSPTLLSAATPSSASSPSTVKNLWAKRQENFSHVCQRGERSRSSLKALHHHFHQHHSRNSDMHRDPPPQPPISKMDSCHISEDHDRWESIRSRNGVTAGTGSSFSTSSSPAPAFSPRLTIPDTGTILQSGVPRLRVSRQAKSRGRTFSCLEDLASADLSLTGKDSSMLDAAETDGYFSDGEQSDVDTRSGRRKLRLAQLHSGNEDLLRRSVLAS